MPLKNNWQNGDIFTPAAANDIANAVNVMPPGTSRLFTSFADKTSIPAFGDEGVAVTIRGGSSAPNNRFIVQDGLLQAPSIAGVAGDRAAYWNQPLAGGSRIGGTFKFAASDDLIDGNVTFIFWANAMPTPYAVPDTGLHLAITPNFWEYGAFESGSFTSLGSGFLATPLTQDWNPAVAGSGTLYRAEVSVRGTTATIVLPDGAITTVTDARIGSIARNVACHEVYLDGDGPRAAFADIWADDSSGPVGATSLTEVARVSRLDRPNPLPLMTANMIAAGSFARPATYANLAPGAISTEVAATGTRSWKLTSVGAFQGLVLTRDAVGNLFRVETQPSRTFRWEAKLRKAAGNTGGGAVTLGIDTFTEALSSLGQPGVRSVTMDSLSSSAWATISGVGTTPANTCFVELRLSMAGSVPLGDELFIDDVILEDVTRDVNRSGRPTSHTTVTTTGTLTINADLVARADVTALAESLTINAPTGTPNGGQELTICIVDDGTARALTWNSIWLAKVAPLPTTTSPGRSIIFQAQWLAASAKWQVLHQIGAGTPVLRDPTDSEVLEVTGTGQDNYLSVANSATNPTISAVGSSSDVSISLVPKGLGSVKVGTRDVLVDIDQPHDLAVGENTFPRRLIDTPSCTLTNGQLRLTYFTARKTETVTQIRALVTTASVGATLARVGIYEEATNGDLALIASTATDTALFGATGTITKALSASWSKTRGVRYAVGLLSVGTSTAPTFHGIATGLLAEMNLAPRLSAFIGSQTDLPATVSDASVSGSALQYYVALAP
jgi:hypothetical protein